jgi:thiamine biosynthesis protein ThiS
MPEAPIEIVVNGTRRQIAAGTSLQDLIEELKLPWKFVAAERNRQLVPRPQQAGCILEPGDELEIVTLVGGG